MQIRESIKALFPSRTCFPLVRPMSDETQLQRLEAVPQSQLRPEFTQVLLHLSTSSCTAPFLPGLPAAGTALELCNLLTMP